MKWMVLLPLFCGLFLQGCASSGDSGSSGNQSRYHLDADRPPETHADVSAVPEPFPDYEPRSRGGNKSPYRVLGQTYHVLPTAEGFVEEGIASWYGAKFHGYHTSNGEIYDMYALTAAHKHLPLPGYVRVTNLDNGRQLIVRVNDRGPFHAGRIIDLSYAAASRLGVLQTGTARVRIENVMPTGPGTVVASTPPATVPAAIVPPVNGPAAGVPVAGTPALRALGSASPAPLPPTPGLPATGTQGRQATALAPAQADSAAEQQRGSGGVEKPDVPLQAVDKGPGYVLQVGAYASEVSAQRVREEVGALVDSPVFLDSSPTQNQAVHRVRVGPFDSPFAARRILELLQRTRFSDTLLIPIR